MDEYSPTAGAESAAPVQVIAEIGCNHRGDLATALEMVRVAAACGADIVKFQKRTPRELLSPAQFARPHPEPTHAYGPSYGAHREALELEASAHAHLAAACARAGVAYSTSVWDMTAAREMAALAPPMLKIPSAANQNFAMQAWLCDHFGGEIHASTGMTTRAETEALVAFYTHRGRARDLVLYACTSGYPVAFEDVCLYEIAHLMETYGRDVRGIGFSGHHLGGAADIAALAVGRMCAARGQGRFTHIERHFTLNRGWKGTDHAASLEPAGLRRLCRDLADIGAALARKRAEILPVEEAQRAKLKSALRLELAHAG